MAPRRIAGALFALVGVATPSWAELPAPPSPLPLEWCLERALAENPGLQAQEAGVAAARERIVPAGAFDDPRFGYQASNMPTSSFDFGSTPMSGHQLTLTQKIPFPGLLGRREAAARAGLESESGVLDDRRRRVASDVERAWAELGFAQRALVVTDRNGDLLRQLAQIAEVRYRVGSGLQQDVLRAQVELTRLLDERLGREAAVARSEAALASLLDLDLETGFERTGPLREEAPVPSLADLFARLEAVNPLLHAQRARVEEAEQRTKVARFRGYPDVDLGLGYRIRERAPSDPVKGDDFFSAGVTFRLPVNRSRWRAEVAEREALVRRAKAEYRSTRAGLREVLRAHLADLQRAGLEVTLLETGLVPQTRQSFEANRAGYEVDKLDFLAVIDSQVRLLEAELRLLRAEVDRRVSFASLEAAFGERLR